MKNLTQKKRRKTLIICLMVFNFLLFLIIFNYIFIEGDLNMSQNIWTIFVIPIVSSVFTSLITVKILNYFSKKEKWKRLEKKIIHKYPDYRDIDKYYLIKEGKNILQTDDGEMPIRDLFFIINFYKASIRRNGHIDEIEEVYSFLYKFSFSMFRRINKIRKTDIKIQSGGKEEFTDVLLEIKMSEMLGKKIDRDSHLEKYRRYLLNLTTP